MSLDPSTVVVALGRPERAPDAPLNTPITPTSSFITGGDIGYARYGNPTTEAFEVTLAALEGGTVTAFASGMAAASAVIDRFEGQRVLITRPGYAGVSQRMSELAQAGRISLTALDATDIDGLRSAAGDHDLIWLESPTNPMLAEVPIEEICTIAHAAGGMVIVDNTFATPLVQRPLELGADFVMHSVTKMLSGHSDVLMGAVATRDEASSRFLRERRVLLGAAPSPFDAYLALRGMRTLALRVARSQESAATLAHRLQEHPAIELVRYPGFGSVLSIDIAATPEHIDRMCAATRLWANATSLGGVESLLERRRSWEHEDVLVPENLVRLSVGIEHVDDLWQDLTAALATE